MPSVLAPTRAAVAVAAALALVGMAPLPVHAADSNAFVVGDGDGYGISDCMRPGMDCGRVIADAWCESHGLGHATAFGPADDVTGSIEPHPIAARPITASAVIIRCGD